MNLHSLSSIDYYNHHPLRQWDYPIEQFDQSLKKCTVLLLWDERVVCGCALSLALRYCVTEHNASGRKWICSFKWCMGSFWTPFCGQEWSSLNYCKWNQLLLGLPLLRLSLYLLPSYSSLGAEILLLSQQLLQFHNHQVQVEDTCQPSVHLSVTTMPTNLPSLS